MTDKRVLTTDAQNVNVEGAYPKINAKTPDEALAQSKAKLNGALQVADLNKAPGVDLNVADQYPKTMEFPNTPTSIKTVPEYCALIRGWATDRNIIGGGSTPLDQFIKGLTEAGELWTHIGKAQHELIKDDIGDVIVCIINSMGNHDLNLEDYLDDSLLPNGSPTNMRLYEQRGLKRYSLQVLYALTAFAKHMETIEDGNLDVSHIDVESIKMFMADEAATLVCVLDTIARAHKWSLEECLAQAYTDIKDRKGLMVSGTFVKEKDFTIEMVNNALADDNATQGTRDYLNEWLQNNA